MHHLPLSQADQPAAAVVPTATGQSMRVYGPRSPAIEFYPIYATRSLGRILIPFVVPKRYNAVPGLLERFRVSTVYVSPMMFDGFDDTVSRGPQVLREAIREAGIPIREVWSSDQLRVGGEVTVQVLHPPRRGVLGSDNANSITLAVEHGGRRVLLPGDLESPGLEDVMAELPYDCDVLLAPHHGSRLSDPPGFAAWSTPEWVVISGGAGDEVRPVAQTYEHAGAQVLRTNETGTVHFSIGAGPMKMATWWNVDKTSNIEYRN